MGGGQEVQTVPASVRWWLMTSQASAEQLWKEQGAEKTSSSLREAFASRPKKEFSVFICILENKAVLYTLNTYVAQMWL